MPALAGANDRGLHPPGKNALDQCVWIRHASANVARVALTAHLLRFFPQFANRTVEIRASSVGELIAALEASAPGFAFYVCDEAGRLRRHVNIFVDDEMIRDRGRLTDSLAPESRVSIMQALSGG